MNDNQRALQITADLEEELKSKFNESVMNSVRPTRPIYGEIPGTSERDVDFARQFKQKLCERNRHIRDYYTWAGEAQRLTLFPSLALEDGPIGDYDTTVAGFLQCFERDCGLLGSELNSVGSEVGSELQKARKRKNETQQIVAEFIGCDVSTISRIEASRQIGQTHAEAIQAYIARPDKLSRHERYSVA